MKRHFISLAVLVLLGFIQPIQAQHDRAVDEAAIRDNVKQMVTGWNTKNGSNYAQVFAEDADFVVINGMYVKGRAEIEKSHQRIFDTIFKDTTVSLDVKQIRFLKPDVVVVHVTGRRDGPTDDLKQGAIITMVMTKEKQGWKVVAFQNTAAPLK
jgi:uncharacterized protein (TIGR02246 family)